jgi:hypothetical protein
MSKYLTANYRLVLDPCVILPQEMQTLNSGRLCKIVLLNLLHCLNNNNINYRVSKTAFCFCY